MIPANHPATSAILALQPGKVVRAGRWTTGQLAGTRPELALLTAAEALTDDYPVDPQFWVQARDMLDAAVNGQADPVDVARLGRGEEHGGGGDVPRAAHPTGGARGVPEAAGEAISDVVYDTRTLADPLTPEQFAGVVMDHFAWWDRSEALFMTQDENPDNDLTQLDALLSGPGRAMPSTS